MSDPMATAWAWIDDHPTEYRSTEIHLPAVLAVAPVWLYQENRGGWTARLDVAVGFDELVDAGLVSEPLGSIIECTHGHPTPEDAWRCAADLARRVVDHVIGSANTGTREAQ